MTAWFWRALRYLADRRWRYRGDPKLAARLRRQHRNLDL